jgi:hypothetical protein
MISTRRQRPVVANQKDEKELTGMLAYIVAAREMKCGSVHSKCLLLYYASNCGKDGSFFKSTVDIAAETGLSERFIRKTNAIWESTAVGILSSIQGSSVKHQANTYQLNLPKLRSICDKNKTAIEDRRTREKRKAAERAARYRAKKSEAKAAVTLPDTVTRDALEYRDT